MNEQVRMLKQGVLLAVAMAGGLVALFLLQMLSWPWLLNLVENVRTFRMQPEGEIRAIIWYGFLLITAAMGFLRALTGRRLFARLFWLFGGIAALLVPMFLFDPTHLKDELAWVRYPTAAFLLAAAFGMWLVSRRFNRGERFPKVQEWIWLVFGFGFLFAAADEIMQIHEVIGGFIERTVNLSHVTTDAVTAVYGLIGFVVVLFAIRALRAVWHELPRLFHLLMFAGITFFVLATFFDTFDFVFVAGLNGLVNHLYAGGMEALPDVFAFWYAPNLLLNGYEEVFEMTAAVFFSLAALSVVRDVEGARREVTAPQRRRVWTFGSVVAAALILPSLLFTPLFKADSPFSDGRAATALASAKQGLYHSDDLAYDKDLGILLANESRPDYAGRKNGPGVFRFRDGAFARLPDPDGFLTDSDSVAIMDGSVFVSDGASGFVLRFDEAQQRFVRVAGRDQGFKVPEAMAPRDGDLFVVDEHFRSIARMTKDGVVTQDFVEHADFRGPEDLVYVPSLEAFLITDDRRAKIFRYDPAAHTLNVWADRDDGLVKPESIVATDDGHLLITDNGAGEIQEFDLEGNRTNHWRLRFLYRDGQGIARQENDSTVFVTANAWESASFMPSVLWTTRLEEE